MAAIGVAWQSGLAAEIQPSRSRFVTLPRVRSRARQEARKARSLTKAFRCW